MKKTSPKTVSSKSSGRNDVADSVKAHEVVNQVVEQTGDELKVLPRNSPTVTRLEVDMIIGGWDCIRSIDLAYEDVWARRKPSDSGTHMTFLINVQAAYFPELDGFTHKLVHPDYRAAAKSFFKKFEAWTELERTAVLESAELFWSGPDSDPAVYFNVVEPETQESPLAKQD